MMLSLLGQLCFNRRIYITPILMYNSRLKGIKRQKIVRLSPLRQQKADNVLTPFNVIPSDEDVDTAGGLDLSGSGGNCCYAAALKMKDLCNWCVKCIRPALASSSQRATVFDGSMPRWLKVTSDMAIIELDSWPRFLLMLLLMLLPLRSCQGIN